MRRLLWIVPGLALLLIAFGYGEAVQRARVVSYTVRSAAWRAPPLRIAVVSDTHAVYPDMPPSRIVGLCDQVTDLRPDLVVLAGDYMSQRSVRTRAVDVPGATMPFARCRARLGVFAVLGNHDMIEPGLATAVTQGLRGAGVVVLRNSAARVGGFWIAGIDDGDYGAPNNARALAHVPRGASILFVAHDPDWFEYVPPTVALTIAGHTHGGQVVPLGAPLVLPVNHRAWARGLIRDHGAQMVVTSGVGASGVPIRIGVPPEIALITLEGAPPSP